MPAPRGFPDSMRPATMNFSWPRIPTALAAMIVFFIAPAMEAAHAPSLVAGLYAANAPENAKRHADEFYALRKVAWCALIGVVSATAIAYGALRFTRRRQ